MTLSPRSATTTWAAHASTSAVLPLTHADHQTLKINILASTAATTNPRCQPKLSPVAPHNPPPNRWRRELSSCSAPRNPANAQRHFYHARVAFSERYLPLAGTRMACVSHCSGSARALWWKLVGRMGDVRPWGGESAWRGRISSRFGAMGERLGCGERPLWLSRANKPGGWPFSLR